MLKFAVLFVVIFAVNAQLFPPTGIRRYRPGPVIQTTDGPVQGQEEIYDLFRRIYTYKGIPYAQPPVMNLRFREGFPPVPWTETKQAWEYGPECPQFSLILNRFQGDEDCLYLNIATPTNIRSRLPVVVSIHGGGLQFGSGEISQLGPEFINQEGVIFVSLNYRLNVLGFLNTNDVHSPGNYGLKDIILALKWIQANIANFGGDPDNVTIMGISGGAVAVHAMVVSPAAAGLFSKAVSQSGSLFNNWAFNRNPRPAVQMLTRNLQLNVANNSDLMNQLREVSTERLLRAADLSIPARPSLIDELNFMPSLDPFDSTETIIFPAPVSFLVRTGNINRVPYMIGFNYAESMGSLRDAINDPTILERFNQNPYLLVPSEWNLEPGTVEANQVIGAIRETYFGGSSVITPSMAWQWSNYISDREFIFGISKQAQMHRVHQDVYYSRFSYSGALSFIQRILGLSDVPGASHGDDMFYLFRLNILITPVAPGDEAFTIQRRYVRLCTNFYKYGDPTPSSLDPLIRTKWSKMGPDYDFLDIGQNLSLDMHPFAARLSMWHALDERFGQ